MKLPIAGFNWIMKQIQTMANEELLNDQPWKERLIELQMMLEVGDISEEEYAVQEAQVFQALRESARVARRWRGSSAAVTMTRTAASASTPDTAVTLAAAFDTIAGRRVILFGGKGGVGKTTVSIAAALHLAQVAAVILFTTDPASNLSDILHGELRTEAVDAERVVPRAFSIAIWRVSSSSAIAERISTKTSCGDSSSCRCPASTS